MRRIGYDADTQTYTFEDTATGRIYESAPGNRYGVLNPVGQAGDVEIESRDPFGIAAHNAEVKKGNKEAVRLMLPFALLVLVSLLLLIKFLYGGSGTDTASQVSCGKGADPIQIKKGETCWAIAEARAVGVADLLALEGNENIDCDNLRVGQSICVPV